MNREQCRHCIYYKQFSSVKIDMACHYMLDTGMARVREGDKCYSRLTLKQAKKRGFDAPLTQR
nr:MAG TPA: hypothetical protein [Caudoviricetes sp.]